MGEKDAQRSFIGNERGAYDLTSTTTSVIVVAIFTAVAGLGLVGFPAFWDHQKEQAQGRELHRVAQVAVSNAAANRVFPANEDELDADSPRPYAFQASPDSSCWVAAGRATNNTPVFVMSGLQETEFLTISDLKDEHLKCLGSDGTRAMAGRIGVNGSDIPGNVPAKPSQPVVTAERDNTGKYTGRFSWPMDKSLTYHVRTSNDGAVWKSETNASSPILVAPFAPVNELIDHPATRTVGIEVVAENSSGKSTPGGLASIHVPGRVDVSARSKWMPRGETIGRGTSWDIPRDSWIEQEVEVNSGERPILRIWTTPGTSLPSYEVTGVVSKPKTELTRKQVDAAGDTEVQLGRVNTDGKIMVKIYGEGTVVSGKPKPGVSNPHASNITDVAVEVTR